jgi:hypothetical protein
MRPTRRAPTPGLTKTAKRMLPAGSMRKSPATIAAPSTTREQARLSGTNQSSSRASTSPSSFGKGSTRTSTDTSRLPGARASQSAGKTCISAGSKGRADRPGVKAE